MTERRRLAEQLRPRGRERQDCHRPPGPSFAAIQMTLRLPFGSKKNGLATNTIVDGEKQRCHPLPDHWETNSSSKPALADDLGRRGSLPWQPEKKRQQWLRPID